MRPKFWKRYLVWIGITILTTAGTLAAWFGYEGWLYDKIVGR